MPATLDGIAVITDATPERLRLLNVLAAFVGLRPGELLELRPSHVDGFTGRINVSRNAHKHVVAGARGACPEWGRVVSASKTASGVRPVHVPPPLLPLRQKHRLEPPAAGPSGVLFLGDRAKHERA